jgi:hypothetical protein
VGALGTDRAGKAGTHPRQVVGAIIRPCGTHGRVVVVLPGCRAWDGAVMAGESSFVSRVPVGQVAITSQWPKSYDS